MIVHVILFEPRADLTPDERVQVLEDFRQAAAAISSVRRCRVGRRIRHGVPGYEQAMHADYQYAAIVEFDDRAGLTAYLSDPAHASAGRHFTASAAHAIAYDFEMPEADDHGSLARG